jgi:hypothetical protein
MIVTPIARKLFALIRWTIDDMPAITWAAGAPRRTSLVPMNSTTSVMP